MTLLGHLKSTLLIVCITLLLLEGTLRLYHAINPLFIFPDNSDNRFRSKPFAPDFDFALNAGGFKDVEFVTERRPGTRRIVGIGDSFVFGVVPYPDNFLTLLEHDLNGSLVGPVEIFNMGISRTSPREYFSVLVKEALPLKPDVALVFIFVGNDFIEISRKPILQHSFVIAAGKYVYDLFRHVEGANAYGGRGQYDDHAATLSQDKFLEIEVGRSDIYVQDSPFLAERLPRIMYWMDQIQAVCRENGVTLYVVLIPDELQIDATLQEQVLHAMDVERTRVDFDLPNRALAQALQSRNITYLDLLEPFRNHSRDRILYKPADTHWNLAGNRLAADVLREYFTKEWATESVRRQ